VRIRVCPFAHRRAPGIPGRRTLRMLIFVYRRGGGQDRIGGRVKIDGDREVSTKAVVHRSFSTRAPEMQSRPVESSSSHGSAILSFSDPDLVDAHWCRPAPPLRSPLPRPIVNRVLKASGSAEEF